MERKLIKVRGGKGKKDRYTILSEIALAAYRSYVEQTKPELFPGRREGSHITVRSVQKMFERAKNKAGIGVKFFSFCKIQGKEQGRRVRISSSICEIYEIWEERRNNKIAIRFVYHI